MRDMPEKITCGRFKAAKLKAWTSFYRNQKPEAEE